MLEDCMWYPLLHTYLFEQGEVNSRNEKSKLKLLQEAEEEEEEDMDDEIQNDSTDSGRYTFFARMLVGMSVSLNLLSL